MSQECRCDIYRGDGVKEHYAWCPSLRERAESSSTKPPRSPDRRAPGFTAEDADMSYLNIGERTQEPSAPRCPKCGLGYDTNGDGDCSVCTSPAYRQSLAEQPSPVAPSLKDFWDAQSEWSQATFGTDAERGPIGPLKHLQKEAGEAQEHPEDIFEFADCLFLVFDATRRAGFTLDQLRDACWRKLAINKERHYPKANDMNAAVEHDRSKERR